MIRPDNAATRIMKSAKVNELKSAMVGILDQHENSVTRHRAALKDGHITPAGFAAAVQRDRDAGAWLSKIDGVKADIDKWAAGADEAVAKARKALVTPSGTATEQLLAETRAVRAWDRLRTSVLDGEQNVAQVAATATNALAEAKGDERRILIEELGPYLSKRGISAADDLIDRTLAASDETYGNAVEYRKAAMGIVSHLTSMSQVSRKHLGQDGPNSTQVQIMVRNSGVSDELPDLAGGSRLPDGKAWDAALGEFR